MILFMLLEQREQQAPPIRDKLYPSGINSSLVNTQYIAQYLRDASSANIKNNIICGTRQSYEFNWVNIVR